MVGEGVLLECLGNPEVAAVLIVNRRHYEMEHPKLKEIVVPDFFELGKFSAQLQDYDACFFCAGISSVGMKEAQFTHITYDTTIAFACLFICFATSVLKWSTITLVFSIIENGWLST